MSIPFTQYKLPNGHPVPVAIDRPAEIEAMADRFIQAGGRYECEMLTTGEVSFTAVKDEEDIEIEVCENGPLVRDAVDAIVRRSILRV